MTQIPSTLGAASPNRSLSTTDAINDLDLGTFLDIMIAELQNQDPLNPLDNKDMLAQISQLREVGATDKLTKTLEAVLLGQNIASATNLIGAEIKALSDDGERVEGVVEQVSIEKGLPKLNLNLHPSASASSNEGDIAAGTYAYRVVWEDTNGKLFGIELSGSKAVETTGAEGVDRAIMLRNLPKTNGQKFVYRTNGSGEGDFRLVGIINDGEQGSFVDTSSDAELSETRLEGTFQRTAAGARKYTVSLNNISDIRAPETVTAIPSASGGNAETP